MSFSLSKSARNKTKPDISPSPRKSLIKEHKIHNNQKLKVFIKFKPIPTVGYNNKNTTNVISNSVVYMNEKQLQIQTSLNRKIYTFDHVFDPLIDSQSVFNVGCSQLIQEVIQGVHDNKLNNNGLVFVYGNTGTGKTHTMGLIQQVTNNSQGLVPDSLRHIFEDNNTIEQVCLSFCEIYKDQVYDLLDFEDEKKLNIRQNQKSKQPYIEDLIIIRVNNFNQACQLINLGLQKRKIAQQKVNKRSSRGHGIITIYLKNQNSTHSGRVSFVDLAGCQRIKQSQSKGSTLNEALHINTSLSALQTLLMNISDQNVRSYRSNKLTRILQPYFQFGKIRLFVTSNYESIQSIQFAKRCKGIKFHQRQIRKQTQKIFKTPKKSQRLNQRKKQKQNQTKQQSDIKRQFVNRQKVYLKCISNLVSIIHKIYDGTTSAIKNQPIHSSFSLPQLFQHIPLESKVNAKINIFQRKQQQILFDQEDNSFSKMSSQISTNLSQSINLSEDIKNILNKTQQIMKSMQDIGFEVVKKIGQLSHLAQYKNVYKKQWFTSQIKNGLLENKNDQFEKGIGYLIEQFNKIVKQGPTSNTQFQTRIFKRLKQYGIVFSQENPLIGVGDKITSHNPNNRQNLNETYNSSNKTPRKLSTTTKTSLFSKDQKLSKDSQKLSKNIDNEFQDSQNSQRFYNRSRKRSLIYIDQD